MVIVYAFDFDTAGVAGVASVTVIVIGNVPAVVGVPETVPVASRVSPAGSPVADHVYGMVPPDAVPVGAE